MSVAATTAVYRYSQAPCMGSLLILVAMADWADDEGYCFPSHRAICEKTGAGVTTLKRHLREAVRRGELELVQTQGHTLPLPREFVGRTGFKPTNLYRITLVDQLGSKRPEFLERNRAKTAPVRDAGPDQNGGQFSAGTGAILDVERGPNADAHIRKTRQSDTSVDTSDPPVAPHRGARVTRADRKEAARIGGHYFSVGGPGCRHTPDCPSRLACLARLAQDLANARAAAEQDARRRA